MTFTILTVCTANICRSPLAQVLLSQRLDPARFTVESAGIRGFVGSAMDRDAAQQARRLGADPGDFESRVLTAEIAEAADLVLTATRGQRSELLTMSPIVMRRAFTLRELAALAPLIAGNTPADVVTNASRKRSRIRFDNPADFDIADPYKREYEVHAHTAQSILQAVELIAGLLGRRTQAVPTD